MRKLLFPLALGISGLAVLISLGIWQVQRLDWKEAILADINDRMQGAPTQLPAAPDETRDEYRAVTFSGRVVAGELHVLVSGTKAGTGYRVISAFETGQGRRILLDQGLLPLDAKDAAPTLPQTDIVGNLIWPDDVNSSTPTPDLGKNIWFGRDVDAMAQALNTEAVMVVVSNMTNPDPRTTLLPVDTSGIKNDHLEYAVTWFGLAAVWAAMTGFLIFRTSRHKDT